MKLLGDEGFRREALARIHPAVRKRTPLAGITPRARCKNSAS